MSPLTNCSYMKGFMNYLTFSSILKPSFIPPPSLVITVSILNNYLFTIRILYPFFFFLFFGIYSISQK